MWSDDEPREAGETDIDANVATREPYLRQALAEFEAGHIEAYDYTRCVHALNAATSVEDMRRIVDALSHRTDSDGPVTLRGLDAVDLALLRSARSSAPRSTATRYVTLAIVFLLFAVLIGLGMWLAAHVHGAALAPITSSGRLTAATPAWW